MQEKYIETTMSYDKCHKSKFLFQGGKNSNMIQQEADMMEDLKKEIVTLSLLVFSLAISLVP